MSGATPRTASSTTYDLETGGSGVEDRVQHAVIGGEAGDKDALHLAHRGTARQIEPFRLEAAVGFDVGIVALANEEAFAAISRPSHQPAPGVPCTACGGQEPSRYSGWSEKLT